MRAEGLLTDPAGAAQADHVCWIYEDADDFAEVAERYLEAGRVRGERLLWIGDGPPPRDVDQVLDVREAYERSGPLTPQEQLAFYAAATRQAAADGYTGLRVVADMSSIAADPALVRWEHLADEFIGSGSGMVALCAYRGDLDAGALADVATVHPLVHAPDGGPPFRIWFDGDTVAIAGALDAFGADRLDRVLTATPVDRPRVTLDLSRVDFIDVGGCRTLASWARRPDQRGARLELAGTSRVLRRMWRILGFDEYGTVSFREPAG